MQQRDVVITGIGVVSPIGIGREAFWSSLCEGQSGVRLLSRFRDTDMPVRIGAPVADFEPKQYVRPRKALKVMSREIQVCFTAAALAIEDAALTPEQFSAERMGVVCGCDMIYPEPESLLDAYRKCVSDGKFDFSRWGEAAAKEIYPLWLLKYLPNMVSCQVSIAHDARGPSNTIMSGDVSSLLSIAEAVTVIQRGEADVMVAGGVGSRLDLTALMWRGDSNLSHRNDDPPAASRPFDGQRDGMVNGEGGATFVLESVEQAERRGATPLARITGWGNSFGERAGTTAVSQGAIERSIRLALTASQVDASAIDHVNAHGVSTPEDDATEAAAIRELLGDVPVTALKSYFGNIGAGGGALEMAGSILGLVHRQVPGSRNYEHPDPACPVNIINGQPRQPTKSHALMLSQAGTGQAAALVVEGLGTSP